MIKSHQRSSKLFNKGPSLLSKLLLLTFISIILMGVDFRFHYLKEIRQFTNVFTKPLHAVLNLPNDIYNVTAQYFSNQSRLIHDNETLKLDIDQLKGDLQRLDFIDQENDRLRNLLEVKNTHKFKTEAVSIIYSRFDPFNQKIIIDGGQNKDFQPGQPVIDALGLVGQISSVYPETSEVTLIIDKKMSVPIQIQRNGLRAITNGNGQNETISLSYLPNSVDVVKGDILKTSGIDTIYPEGIAVAEVLEINHDPKLPFAKIICKPLSAIRNHSHVLVVTPINKMSNNVVPIKNDQKK
jgi:rod shape-determining protein MreC